MKKIIKLLSMEDRTLAVTGARILSGVLKTKTSEEIQQLVLVALNSLNKNDADKVIEIANGIVLGNLEQYKKHANL